MREQWPGGYFLVSPGSPESVFTPEDFSEEQKMIRDMTEQFVEQEVLPRDEDIEHKNWTVTTSLLRRCGELGLLGIEVAEKHGGENLDKVSAMIVAQSLGRVQSFAVSYGGHCGIGTLPIVYFGSEDCKRRYLPRFCKAELISAYALSEASSGSDALAARATAVRSDDGQHWILNGEKMWITNAAFADVFITFAKVDGTQFSCFIVEKSYPGVSTGAEEKKMGLHGSSTRALVLDNVKVPIGNVVGEIGKGHRVAFNILNVGRLKLGANAVGAGKTALNDAIRYAKQRIAFGRPIASFGAIQHKLAEMAIRLWVTEAMVYRTAGMIDRAMEAADIDNSEHALRTIEQYAVECSILKVFGSEVLDFVVDEAVQIYGGYGYTEEYPVERYYRDSRANRIFEGTNEINRMIIPTMLMKRAASGALPLQEAIRRVGDSSAFEGPWGPERQSVDSARRMTLLVADRAIRKYGDNLRDEQEVLAMLSDMAIHVYAMDSALCRLSRKEESPVHAAIVRTFLSDAMLAVETTGRRTLAATTEASGLAAAMDMLTNIRQWLPVDTVFGRRAVAAHLIHHDRYAL